MITAQEWYRVGGRQPLGVKTSSHVGDPQVIDGQNPVPVEAFCGLPSELDNARLEGRLVVVLSNNAGCIMARSNEAKALSLALGNLYHLHRLLTTVPHTPLPHVTCVIGWGHHHAAGRTLVANGNPAAWFKACEAAQSCQAN